ncbi:MAG TPA: uroporphyrinogen decarboxylase family protein [Ktedonobacteraceae bacterium]|nr:uroporphyrinogen decarboxylase family protein [Ktedonobacteraceae bacterium]
MSASQPRMTANERVRAALVGEQVDRVPFVFWHHFKPEGSGERMAQLTKAFFHDTFDLDIIKIMPDLPYPEPGRGITAAELRTLPKLGLDTPIFQEQLTCIRILRAQLGEDYPIILTIFSPLTYALRWIGRDKVVEAARLDPQAFEQGLATIAENLRGLLAAAIEAGASGIFFSCMGATNRHFTRDEYARLGRPYDLQALAGTGAGWLNIVHVHADPEQVDDEIYFEDFVDYPVQVMSWSDRLTGPSLSEALSLTDKCLMGGLAERGPLTHGSEAEIENEILGAVTQTKHRRLILANGCSIPDDNPENWLHSARRLVDRLR